MQDRKLHQQILGLKGRWKVCEIKLSIDKQQLDVFVEHPPGTMFCCQKFDESLPCYDLSEVRCRRHLESCHFKAVLHARIP